MLTRLVHLKRWKTAAAAALLIATSLGGSSVSYAQTAAFLQQLQGAKDLEAQGDLFNAGHSYLALFDSPHPMLGPIPADVRRAIARRGTACIVAATRKNLVNGVANVDEMTFNSVKSAYQSMCKAEPNNPTWPYLLATCYSAEGQYVEAARALKLAMNDNGGQESVRQKVRRLNDHIKGYANTDYQRMQASDAAAVQALISGHWRPSGPVPHSSSGSDSHGIHDNSAADNAAARGDWGAASRLHNGNGSWSDHETYK